MTQSKWEKKRIIEMKKGSSAYNAFVARFPDSRIAKDSNRGFPHGGFGTALKEGRIEDAVYSADLNNILRLKKLGIEKDLEPHARHHLISHSEFAEKKGIKV